MWPKHGPKASPTGMDVALPMGTTAERPSVRST